jgi:hypothetical protein
MENKLKIAFISDGKDGAWILRYLKSLGGKNKYYGFGDKNYFSYRWKASDINKGNYVYIDWDDNEKLIFVKNFPPGGYEIKSISSVEPVKSIKKAKMNTKIDRIFETIDPRAGQVPEWVNKLAIKFAEAMAAELNSEEIKALKAKHQIQLADAQFVGFIHARANRDDLTGLVDTMGLTEEEWLIYRNSKVMCLTDSDVKEIDDFFSLKQ